MRDAAIASAGRSFRRHWRSFVLGLAVWGILAYLLAPRLWNFYFEHAKPLPDVARVTHTSDGHPGDPVNIALEGSEADVVKAMLAAGWYPADPVTLSSSVRIAVDTALRRPDDTAPVSPLYLFGRKEDLAFEKPVPGGPRHRHHVRYWRWDQERDGLPVWFGAATYDEHAGLSYTTGQVTHHIGPDVDAERDLISSGSRTCPVGRRRRMGRRLPPAARGAQRRRRPAGALMADLAVVKLVAP